MTMSSVSDCPNSCYGLALIWRFWFGLLVLCFLCSFLLTFLHVLLLKSVPLWVDFWFTSLILFVLITCTCVSFVTVLLFLMLFVHPVFFPFVLAPVCSPCCCPAVSLHVVDYPTTPLPHVWFVWTFIFNKRLFVGHTQLPISCILGPPPSRNTHEEIKFSFSLNSLSIKK